MHFIGWLEEQEDTRIHKLIMDDYNNGCLPHVRNVGQLREHFVKKHPYNGPKIIALLDEAFASYTEEQNG